MEKQQKYWIQSKTASQYNLCVWDISWSFISDMDYGSHCYPRKFVTIIGWHRFAEWHQWNQSIKSMPNLKKVWYCNNYPISSLESQCPNLTQNRSWNQEIGVPGHGDSIWEIKCKPSNSFPRRQDLVQHEKEVKKFIQNCYLWNVLQRQ